MATINVYRYDNDIDIKDAVLDPTIFEQNIVIAGNDDLDTYEDAEWWTRSKSILADIDYFFMGDNDDDVAKHLAESWNNIDSAMAHKIIDVYKRCHSIKDIEVITETANILYPDRVFDYEPIHGSVQREWQYIIFDKEYAWCVDEIEEYYFGQFVYIEWEEEHLGGYMTDSRYDTYDSLTLREEIREEYGIPEDEDIEINEQAGYVTTLSWNII